MTNKMFQPDNQDDLEKAIDEAQQKSYQEDVDLKEAIATIKFGIFNAITSETHNKEKENYAKVTTEAIYHVIFSKAFRWAIEDIVKNWVTERGQQVMQESKEQTVTPVGTLNSSFGLKGYITAEPGTIVYELKDRYIIYLKSERSDIVMAVPFYKETLAPSVNFYIA